MQAQMPVGHLQAAVCGRHSKKWAACVLCARAQTLLEIGQLQCGSHHSKPVPTADTFVPRAGGQASATMRLALTLADEP